MRSTWRRFALLCLVAGSAIAILVPGGGAANRDGEATFAALPGPGSVTYGKNIAYSATFENTNTSGSVFTQVTFHQSRPVATFNGTSYPAELIASSCNAAIDTQGDTDPTNDELTCKFDQLRPGDEPLHVTVVWQAPTIPSQTGCPSCLTTKGSWTIKENKATNGNESFPPEGPIVVPAELLGGKGTAETNRAGSYELSACTGGNPNLSTNQDVNVSNPVATSFCLPPFQTSGRDLGLATTIDEGSSHAGDPGVTGLRSDVCIADLGENCGAFGDYRPFGFTSQITLVFLIADAALPNGTRITQVFHNGDPVPLPSCQTEPTNANGCTDSIVRSGGPVKIWTIVVKSKTNGFYNW
jgi:hypothetical protein